MIFFFQAEDGIRDYKVTGVQTCALPIWPSGELLIGATVERVGFQRTVTALGIAGLLQAAIDLVPALGGLPISRTWYGFRPWAPDSMPIIGPWPGVDGLWVATAHF